MTLASLLQVPISAVALGALSVMGIGGLLVCCNTARWRALARAQALKPQLSVLRQREAYATALFAHSRQAMVVMDPVTHRFVDCNSAAVALYGLASREALLGLTPIDVSDPVQYDGTPSDAAASCQIQAALRRGSHVFEWRHRRPDDHCWDAEVHLMVIDAAGATVILFTLVDISARKQAEREIEMLAYYDPLTRLPNRRLMLDRLGQALAGSEHSGEQGALILIDLDNFKSLNDSRGHEAGDRVLLEMARRLQQAPPTGDTVARLGGDEFVVILRGLAGDECGTADAERVAERLLKAVAVPYAMASSAAPSGEPGYLHFATASMGIAMFQGQSLSSDELMRRADAAMYQAKDAGRNTLRFFDPVMESRMLARVALEAELRCAIDGQQFVLHYQPQVGRDGRIRGAEALLRWQHPTLGLVPPMQFIPMAEQSGLIVPLGAWVLEQACTQLARWRQLPAMAGLPLSVNVSSRQFGMPGFEDLLRQLLQRTGADPRQLKLELTESVLMEDTEETVAKMRVVKALGVTLAMDDFGTGFSSLSYLKNLPLDQLKIDRSFVRDVEANPSNAAIARTIVALGQSLGMDVIAEGVETQAQMDFLVSIGCHGYQGYLFGRPMGLGSFENLKAGEVRYPESRNAATAPLQVWNAVLHG